MSHIINSNISSLNEYPFLLNENLKVTGKLMFVLYLLANIHKGEVMAGVLGMLLRIFG